MVFIVVMEMTRRDLMAGALAASAVIPGMASATSLVGGRRDVGDLLVAVPEALPEKVYNYPEAGISKKTHDNHLALWQGYAKKTNEIRTALKDLDVTTAGANQVYSTMRALKANYAFAWGGYINHLVYFSSLGGKDQRPEGNLLHVIEESYGSYENWEKDFKASCSAARGWVYVAFDEMSGRVFNLLGDSQDTFPAWGHRLLMACDVYEHAYYFDFGRNRGEYVDAFLKCVDWKGIALETGF